MIHVIPNVLAIPDDITDTAEDAGLSSLDSALDSTDLDDALERARGITIFAPR